MLSLRGPTRRIGFLAAVLSAITVLTIWLVYPVAWMTIVRTGRHREWWQYLRDLRFHTRQECYYQTTALPYLNHHHKQLQAAVDNCLMRVRGCFDRYRARAPDFASEVTGFFPFQLMTTSRDDNQKFVREVFERTVVSPQQIEQDVRNCIDEFKQDVQALQNELLASLKITGVDYFPSEAVFQSIQIDVNSSFKIHLTALDKLVAEISSSRITRLTMEVGLFVIESIARTAVAKLAARASWVFFALDLLLTAAEHNRITQEVVAVLNQTERDLIEGAGDSRGNTNSADRSVPGLRRQLLDLFEKMIEEQNRRIRKALKLER